MQQDPNKPQRLDALEQRLYSPKGDVTPKGRKPLREKEYLVSRDWNADGTPKVDDSVFLKQQPKKNWFMRFFFVAFLFFVAAAGYVGYKFFFAEGTQAQNVDILVNAPLTVGAGENFAFDVLMQNKNQVRMQTVDIEVELPNGTRSTEDVTKDYTRVRESVGDIAVGAIGKKNYSALLFGEEGDKKEITVRLSYRVEGSNAVFEKEKKFDVVIKSTPVRLTITNVKELSAGQPLVFTVELVSNSSYILQNVLLQANYPFGFQFKNSSYKPLADNKTWLIPKLEPKEVVRFTIEGTLDGQNNEERFFSFVAGLQGENQTQPQVVFTKSDITIAVARPFLELDIAVNKNNSENVAVNADSPQNAVVSFKNNTSNPLRNVKLSLKLDGAALDKEYVQVYNGFFQSANSTITWDPSTSERFALIPVGTSDFVTFDFAGLGVGANSLIVNPELTFTATVEGNRSEEVGVSEKITNTVSRKIRFNTQVALATRSEFYTSTFANSGPVPPKAEQRTSYTATVSLQNSSNKVKDGKVTMQLPNYVNYENATSPASENLSYDAKTRTVTWDVGTVNERTGYLSTPARRVSFKVSLVPSVSQVNSSPILVSNIRFAGTDMFTNQPVERYAQDISTSAFDLKGFYDGQVVK